MDGTGIAWAVSRTRTVKERMELITLDGGDDNDEATWNGEAFVAFSIKSTYNIFTGTTTNMQETL